MKKSANSIVIFKTNDEKVSIDVRLDEETVWLTLDQMAALFERDKSTVSRHIKNVFDDGELVREVVVAKFATTTPHGAIPEKMQVHLVDYYTLNRQTAR